MTFTQLTCEPSSRRRLLVLAGLCGWLACFAACGAPEAPRQKLIHQLLINDNWLMIERAPSLSEGKFRKMGANIYNYFRGTVAVYLYDQTRPGPLAPATQFGDAASPFVASVVDPHPENIGTFLTKEGVLTVDFNDFDGARFSPFHFDVRRLSAGFAIAAQMLQLETKDEAMYKQVIRKVAEGYVAQIQALEAGQPGLQIRHKAGFGTILDDLLRRAKEQGDAKEELDDYTRLKDGKREIFYGEVEASETPGVFRKVSQQLTEEEGRLVRSLLRDYLTRHPDRAALGEAYFRIKGILKRQGAGVSSYPRLRYYMLLEGPTEGSQDDWMLEFKELADMSVIPGLWRVPKQQFLNNAQRVVWMQQQMQEFPRNDPHLGWAEVRPMPFRVRQFTDYQKGFSIGRMVEKVGEGKWKVKDLADYAYHSGRLLARTHAMSPTMLEGKGLPILIRALAGKGDAFVEETASFGLMYAAQVKQDFALFRSLLEEKGGLLAYRPTRERFQ